MKEVAVYRIRTDAVRRADCSALAERMPSRMEKAMRFCFERDRLLCLGAGLLMIQALGIRNESELRYGEYGKPYASGYPSFNISHSGEWCVLACGETDNIGVDIEEMNEKHLDVAPVVYTEAERDWMKTDPVQRFFRLWTWKESVMKATGMGMNLDPGSFEVLPFGEGKPVRIRNRNWYARDERLEGCRVSVCADEPIEQLRWTEIGE